MISFRRLWRKLTQSRSSRLTFQMDQAMVDSLHDLAVREQRPPEDLAQDLLAFALEERRHADENLKRWQDLSPREQQVAALACLNYTNRQIAAMLVISPETVKTHMRNILQKFSLRSKAELRQALSDWDFSAWQGTE
ncbi:MAG: helix-turn-helix transcriptional regulator [Anaerolineales bacterium]|nr:helix-turn-helix transcriptional regulator [Anaerolineales bacterium]